MKKEDFRLGDKVEQIIKTIAPKLSERKKGCRKCKQRKEWLNNLNGNFS